MFRSISSRNRHALENYKDIVHGPFRVNVVDEDRWLAAEYMHRKSLPAGSYGTKSVNPLTPTMMFPRVLAIDPGRTTGLAVAWIDPDVLFDPAASVRTAVVAWSAVMIADEENKQIQRICKAISILGSGPWANEGLAVVTEDFIPRSLNKSRDFLSPVRINAVLDHELFKGVLAERWGCKATERTTERITRPLSRQSPSDAKTVITDGRLKNWIMYTPGPDHARDATRHALLWVRRMKAAGPGAFRNLHGY